MGEQELDTGEMKLKLKKRWKSHDEGDEIKIEYFELVDGCQTGIVVKTSDKETNGLDLGWFIELPDEMSDILLGLASKKSIIWPA